MLSPHGSCFRIVLVPRRVVCSRCLEMQLTVRHKIEVRQRLLHYYNTRHTVKLSCFTDYKERPCDCLINILLLFHDNKDMKVGDTIQTVYGTGKLVSYRELNNVYELDLPFGKLYANQTTVLHGKESEVPKQNRSMEINVAYEALEKMRRLNLEVTCQEHGIFNVDFDKCVTCLLTEANEVATVQNARFPRLRNLVDQTKKLKPKRMSPPCLICGSPVCADHSSKSFRAEKINVCLDCEKLFNFEYIVDCLTTEKKERRERIDRMIDLYDRTALLLKYSAQYIDGVAESLEQAMTRQNKIGVGGSTAGIMSGALGIAAAATILTPAGPPLLIASLLFGGR